MNEIEIFNDELCEVMIDEMKISEDLNVPYAAGLCGQGCMDIKWLIAKYKKDSRTYLGLF